MPSIMTLMNKNYSAILFVLLALLSSCATILNSPVQKILITSDKNIRIRSVEKVALIDSTSIGINDQIAYYVVRSTQPLKVNIQIDTIKKTILLKSRNSLAFWANIFSTDGVGMLVDKDNLKRYAYPNRNYFYVVDTSVKRSRFAPVKKGTINLSLSLPFLTVFNVKSITSRYNSAGVLGLGAGMDYFYQDNHYLSLNIGAATDQFAEHLGVGYYETAGTIFANVSNNKVTGSFDFGYGMNLSELIWTQQTNGDTTKNNQSLNHLGLGLSLSAQYRLGNYLRFGVLYQPVLFDVSPKTIFGYQHFISLNLVWKLPIKERPE